MKPVREFRAERPLASHCAELFGRGAARADDGGPALARLATALARQVAAGLARLAGGEAPKVVAAPPREMTMAQLGGGIAPLAANSLLGAGAGKAALLASIEADVVLRLLDRAFGGRGRAPTEMPDAFPLSAELLIARLEAMICDALGATLGRLADDAGRGGAPSLCPLRRDGSLAALAPFAADHPLHVILLDVEEDNGETWSITLAIPPETLPALFDDAPAPGHAARRAPADPGTEPFAEVPMTLRAVLVDMAIGFSRLAALKPGDVIPVAVARQVPLVVGGRTIAHGVAGAMDDRVAVQITRAF